MASGRRSQLETSASKDAVGPGEKHRASRPTRTRRPASMPPQRRSACGGSLLMTRNAATTLRLGGRPRCGADRITALTSDPRLTHCGMRACPQVRDRHKNKYRVRYDNGDEEDVHMDHVSPTTLPVDFGCESVPLAEGEFCEVSNASKTDPCAWLGRISRGVEGGAYLVEYPLHDSKPEKIKVRTTDSR
eukprot:364943-Chlamydomonas_euryale.AAC.12